MLVLSKVNFLNGHECNWYSMFNVGVLAEPLAFGVRCEDYDDPDGSDGIGFGLGGGDGRTVTDLILPRETCSIVLQIRRRFHVLTFISCDGLTSETISGKNNDQHPAIN